MSRSKSDQRDLKDYNREISPLRQAEDAIELNTDPLSIEQVQTRIVEMYRQKWSIIV